MVKPLVGLKLHSVSTLREFNHSATAKKHLFHIHLKQKTDTFLPYSALVIAAITKAEQGRNALVFCTDPKWAGEF